MKTYQVIGNELCEGYRAMRRMGPAPAQKMSKQKVHDRFMFDLLQNIIETQNKPWTIKPEDLMVFDPSHKTKLDYVIRDENNIPKFHFESKDYADIDMLKRFYVDSACVNDLHPEVINVCVAIQNASKNAIHDTTAYFKRITGFNHAFIEHLVTGSKRNSKDKLCILNYTEDQIVEFVTVLGNKISTLVN